MSRVRGKHAYSIQMPQRVGQPYQFLGNISELYGMMRSADRNQWIAFFIGFLLLLGLGIAGVIVGGTALNRLNKGFVTPMVETPMLNVTGKANMTDASIDNVWIDVLDATTANLVNLVTETVVAITATFQDLTTTTLEATTGTIETLTTTTLEATTATIDTLTTIMATFQMVQLTELVHTQSGEIPATHNVHHLNNDTAALEMTLPDSLDDYVGKHMTICSIGGNADSVLLGGSLSWTANPGFQSIQFQGNGLMPCCINFQVVTANKINLLDTTCANVCANATDAHCYDPNDVAGSNDFHGWWQAESKGLTPGTSLSAFPYFFIDVTRNPLLVTAYYGTKTAPRITTFEDFALENFQAPYVPPTFELNVYNKSLASPFFGWSKDDGNTFTYISLQSSDRLVSTFHLNFAWYGFWTPALFSGVYRKISFTPRIASVETATLPGAPPAELPSTLLRNLMDYELTVGNHHLDSSFAPQDFIGFENAQALMEEIIDTGKTHVTDIHNVYITQNVADSLTRVRTTEYHHVAPPATVTISGYTGACAAVLNGVFDVCGYGTTNTLSIDENFEDYGPDPDNRTVHHDVCIFLDTSALTANSDGTAICTGTPVLSVSYGPIFDDTEYRSTVGAFHYWAMESLKVSEHHRLQIIMDPETRTPTGFGVERPLETWADVATEYAAGTQVQRFYQLQAFETAPGFYLNGAAKFVLGGLFTGGAYNSLDNRFSTCTDLLGRFDVRPDIEGKLAFDNSVSGQPITQDPLRGPFWYDIPKENYLENVSYPVWTATGTSKTGPFNGIVSFLYGTGEGDELVAEMIDYDTNPVTPQSYLFSAIQANNPIFGLYDDYFTPHLHDAVKSNFYAGRIKTSLTGGPKIGYIRMAVWGALDPFGVSINPNTVPASAAASERPIYENQVQLFSTVVKYLIDDLECTEIIVDQRGNPGGQGLTGVALRQLFGSTAYQYGSQNMAPPNNAKDVDENPIDVTTFRFAPDVDAANIDFQVFNVDPAASETFYPGSVFTGGDVLVLSSTTASSTSDIFINSMLGEDLDGDLGSGTTRQYMGSIDGRFHGGGDNFKPAAPAGRDTARVFDDGSNPRQPISISTEFAFHPIRNNNVSMGNRIEPLEPIAAPSLTGKAGGNPLPQDWDELVYPDLGFVTNARPQLPGDARPATPTVIEEVDALDTVDTSNTVTLTTSGAHGFSTGKVIAINGVQAPVSGIPAYEINGVHTITVTGATTFTFDTPNTAATATASGVGGTTRVMCREEWRDAWLEQGVLELSAKRRRRGPAAPKPRLVDPVVQNVVRQMPRSEHVCSEGVSLTSMASTPGSIEVEYDNTHAANSLEARIAAANVFAAVNEIITTELNSGGLCYDGSNHLMVTPSCQGLPKIMRKNDPHGLNARR